jgi:hypothetical protein
MASEPDSPTEDMVGGYRAPEVCDIDTADDREFLVVAGPAPPSETSRN